MVGLGSQFRPCMRVVSVILALCLITVFYTLGNGGDIRQPIVLVAEEPNASQVLGKDGFLVWSPSCQLVDMNPYHKSIKKFLKKADPIICSHIPPLTYTSHDDGRHKLVIDDAMVSKYVLKNQILTCCYSVVKRVNTPEGHAYNDTADDYINITKCTEFKKESILDTEVEYIIVKCHSQNKKKSVPKKEVYKNMHAVVPIKEEVKYKVPVAEDTGEPQALSVLVLGIDSVSRLNLIRTMPKTVSHLKHRGWIELRGYNKIGDNTFPNLMALLTGLSVKQASKLCWKNKHTKIDDCPFIWKEFNQSGYVTAYLEDEPKMSTFNYHKTGFVKPPTDYYYRSFMLAAEKTLSLKKRDTLNICLGATPTTDYMLRYITDFTTTFRNALYFALVWINNFSHNNHNTPSAMDHRFQQFFTELIETGAMNSTLVVFLSDHGMRFGKIRETFVGWLEERLPFIYLWVPEWFRDKYPKSMQNLEVNMNRLTSPYDIHLTLKDVLERTAKREVADENKEHNTTVLSECPNCMSLFSEPIGDRSCDDAGVSPHWCTCSQYQTLSTKGDMVQDAAKFVLIEIQAKLTNAENGTLKLKRCAELSLKQIVKARSKVHLVNKDPDHDDYVIMFETVPGDAMFETTVRHWYRGGFQIMGIVSRINSYASHSKCVKDAELKLYCYCIINVE